MPNLAPGSGRRASGTLRVKFWPEEHSKWTIGGVARRSRNLDTRANG